MLLLSKLGSNIPNHIDIQFNIFPATVCKYKSVRNVKKETKTEPNLHQLHNACKTVSRLKCDIRMKPFQIFEDRTHYFIIFNIEENATIVWSIELLGYFHCLVSKHG